MGKVAPNEMIDASLRYVSGCATYYTVCSGSPTDYTQARTTNCLAGIAMTSASFTGPEDDTSGRRLYVSAKTSASITASGSALAVCLLNLANSGLLYVTTCTEQYLVSGGTVDIPQWKINIQDPT